MPDPYALSIKVCGGKDDNDAEEPEFLHCMVNFSFFEHFQTTFTSVFVAQPFWKKYAAVAPGTKLSGRIWSCHRLLGSPSIHEHSTSQCWCGGFWRYLRCTKNVTRRCPSWSTSNDGTEVISIFVEVGFWKQFQLLSSSNLMFWTILCGWYVVAWTEFARWYPIDDLSNWRKDFLWIFWTWHPYKTCPIRVCCRQDLFWQWPIDLFALSRALLLSEAAGSFACSSCHSGILKFLVSFRKLPARRCWEVLPAMPETCVEPHSVLLV